MIPTIARKLIAGSLANMILIVTLSTVLLWIVDAFLGMQQIEARNYREALRNTEAASLGAHMYEVIARTEINRHLGITETKDWMTLKGRAESVIRDVESTAETPDERESVATARSAYEGIVRVFEDQMLPALSEARSLTPEVLDLDQRIERLSEALTRSMNALRDIEVQEAAETNADFTKNGSISIGISAALSAVAAILGLVIAFSLARAIVEPVRAITATMGRLAGGDLQVDIPAAERKDEIGEMARALRIFKDHMEEVERLRVEQIVAEAQRRESEKLAALGHLAGGVAHEINNLLQPIISLSEMAHEDLGDLPDRERWDGTRADLTMVVNSARQAREIVRKILRYARQETPELTANGLVETLDAAVALVRPLLSPGIRLTLDIAPGTGGEAKMHAGEMSQIVTNLAVNADHAMQGQGKLTFSVSKTELAPSEAASMAIAPGEYFLMRVADTGSGMDEATRSRIFDPFFTTKPLGQGTGLGLSMVQGIVQSWNGAVTVASALGQGTQFLLYIPVAEQGAVVNLAA